MYKLEVGQQNPYKPTTPLSINWDENGFMINIMYDKLTQADIENFKTGKLRVDVAYKNGVIFFILEIERFLGSADIAFNALISTNKEEDLECPSNGLGYGIYFVLTSEETKNIEAFRVVGLNKETSTTLYNLIKKQYENNLSLEEYIENVKAVMNTYSTKELKKKYSLAYTTFKPKES